MALLQIEKLTIRFGGLTAVKDVDLQVEPQQIAAVIGPNGAGKTTVFNAVTGIYDPTSGVIRFSAGPLERPWDWRVYLSAAAIALATALFFLVLAANPDLLWKAAVRRPGNEAAALGTDFSYSDAFARAGRYLNGSFELEHENRVGRVSDRYTARRMVKRDGVEKEITENKSINVTYSFVAWRAVSADGTTELRELMVDPKSSLELQEFITQRLKVELEIARGTQNGSDVSAQKQELARLKKEQAKLEAIAAEASRLVSHGSLDSLNRALAGAPISAESVGETWRLSVDGEAVPGLTYATQALADGDLSRIREVRQSSQSRAKYFLIAPLLGIALGATATMVVFSRSRRTPDVIARGGIARTFQNIRLFHNMSALENVLVGMDRHFGYTIFGMIFRTPAFRRSEAERREQAAELLKFVGLEREANGLAKNLPYGDQRRLEIARALATEPKLLLLDEPAAGMNPSESTELMQLIRKIRDRGITVLLIEHHMKLVMGISDRIAVLEYGCKIAEGTPEEIRTNPKVIEAYLGKEEH